jgi:hypothetical protein
MPPKHGESGVFLAYYKSAAWIPQFFQKSYKKALTSQDDFGNINKLSHARGKQRDGKHLENCIVQTKRRKQETLKLCENEV